AEARRTPELRAARALARFPIKLDTPPPLTDLRGLFNLLQAILEARVHESESLEELDAGYAFIERELGRTPGIESYLGRAMELAGRISEPGEVVAYYRLLAMHMPGTLDGLKHGPGKDKLLQIIETLTRHRDPENLRFEFRKKAMSMADRIMEEATGYEDLLELRFFFQQIGERSNRKLLSRKTRELARTADIRAPLYRLLSTLEAEEFDEDGLLELVPAVVAKTESFIAEASLAHLELFLAFYLDTVCPLLRRLRNEPAHVARLMQNYKRQVGLLNIYRDLDHLAREMQRKVVLALCGPRMLARFPEKILGYLTRLPPEFYPDQVMAVLRTLIREKGPGYRFTSADVLRLIAAYPAEEEQGEQE
ncbi:MAG: hypothetical protein U9N45_01150, partial [Gemmatimonadota bacterium]|nr:hypothetical protein [Gemmatimonadota bacterium]